jgi:hypothetical protein
MPKSKSPKSKESIQYDSILVRASLEDTGAIPREPPLKSSPDVIPSGAAPVLDPKTYFTETYDQNVGKDAVAGQNNYLYVRGKNLGADVQSAEVFVYWAKTDDLSNPDVWKGNQLLTEGGHGSAAMNGVDPDAVGVADQAFVWNPDASLGNVPVTLIGVASTNDDPNPIPSLRTPLDFDRFIARKGGIGACDLTVRPPAKPTETMVVNGNFALANAKGTVSFTLRATKVPIGSKVAFKAAKATPGGKPIELVETAINTDPAVFVVDASLDAGYSSTIEFRISLPKGKLAAADNSLSLSASQIPPSSTGGPAKPVILAQYSGSIKTPVSA